MAYELNHANHKGIAFDPVTGNLHALTDASIEINAQTGTAYTLVLADDRKLVTLTNASPVEVTLPANADVAFPLGTVLALGQLGAGAVTLVAPGVTINGVLHGTATTSGAYAPFTLTKVGTDSWWLTGDVGAVTEGDPPAGPSSDKAYERYEGSSYASVTTDAGWALTGDFELRHYLHMVSLRPGTSVYANSLGYLPASELGYTVHLTTAGEPRFVGWWDDSGNPTATWNAINVLPTSLNGVPFWLSLTKVGSDWTFRYTSDLGAGWTSLATRSDARALRGLSTSTSSAVGALTGTGTLSTINAADDPLRHRRFQVWTGGVEGVGTLVLDFDPSEAATGTPANFTAATGEVYTFNGSGTWAIVELP